MTPLEPQPGIAPAERGAPKVMNLKEIAGERLGSLTTNPKAGDSMWEEITWQDFLPQGFDKLPEGPSQERDEMLRQAFIAEKDAQKNLLEGNNALVRMIRVVQTPRMSSGQQETDFWLNFDGEQDATKGWVKYGPGQVSRVFGSSDNSSFYYYRRVKEAEIQKE